MVNNLIIGVVTPLSGINASHGAGVLDSIKMFLSQNPHRSESSGRKVIIVESNDKGDPSLSLDAVRHCLQQGAVAIIGPADSTCAGAVVHNSEFEKIPFILSFATRTSLLSQNNTNIFRVTTPDERRVNLLLRFIRQTTKSSDIDVFVWDDHPDSYSAGLADSLSSNAAKLNFNWSIKKFNNTKAFDSDVIGTNPIILCAPAFAAKWFCKNLKRHKKPNRVFGFGSNNGLLCSESEGIIVVCDIDYHDNNPVVQQYISELMGEIPDAREISLSSILAIHIITQVFTRVFDSKNLIENDINLIREQIISELGTGTFEGLFGSVSFSPNGELIGHEQISILTVKKKKGKYYFGKVDTDKTWGVNEKIAVRAKLIKVVLSIVGFVGFFAALIAIIEFSWLFLPA